METSDFNPEMIDRETLSVLGAMASLKAICSVCGKTQAITDANPATLYQGEGGLACERCFRLEQAREL